MRRPHRASRSALGASVKLPGSSGVFKTRRVLAPRSRATDFEPERRSVGRAAVPAVAAAWLLRLDRRARQLAGRSQPRSGTLRAERQSANATRRRRVRVVGRVLPDRHGVVAKERASTRGARHRIALETCATANGRVAVARGTQLLVHSGRAGGDRGGAPARRQMRDCCARSGARGLSDRDKRRRRYPARSTAAWPWRCTSAASPRSRCWSGRRGAVSFDATRLLLCPEDWEARRVVDDSPCVRSRPPDEVSESPDGCSSLATSGQTAPRLPEQRGAGDAPILIRAEALAASSAPQ